MSQPLVGWLHGRTVWQRGVLTSQCTGSREPGRGIRTSRSQHRDHPPLTAGQPEPHHPAPCQHVRDIPGHFRSSPKDILGMEDPHCRLLPAQLGPAHCQTKPFPVELGQK